MNKKVILISIDGMRPDGFLECKNPYVNELMERSTYCLKASSVMPTVTLPCHLSIFMSVPPERHGTETNVYVPPVRPVEGLFEAVKRNGKRCAMFYGWEELRDVSRPGSLDRAVLSECYTREDNDSYLTDLALEYMAEAAPDFLFLYLVDTDTKGGHDNGWMSEEYLKYVSRAIDCVKRVIEKAADEYTVIVTADHGGHARGHGADMPEDMNIPMFFCGSDFCGGSTLSGISLLDIAPTVAELLEIVPPREWEGRSVLGELLD